VRASTRVLSVCDRVGTWRTKWGCGLDGHAGACAAVAAVDGGKGVPGGGVTGVVLAGSRSRSGGVDRFGIEGSAGDQGPQAVRFAEPRLVVADPHAGPCRR